MSILKSLNLTKSELEAFLITVVPLIPAIWIETQGGNTLGVYLFSASLVVLLIALADHLIAYFSSSLQGLYRTASEAKRELYIAVPIIVVVGILALGMTSLFDSVRGSNGVVQHVDGRLILEGLQFGTGSVLIIPMIFVGVWSAVTLLEALEYSLAVKCIFSISIVLLSGAVGALIEGLSLTLGLLVVTVSVTVFAMIVGTLMGRWYSWVS